MSRHATESYQAVRKERYQANEQSCDVHRSLESLFTNLLLGTDRPSTECESTFHVLLSQNGQSALSNVPIPPAVTIPICQRRHHISVTTLVLMIVVHRPSVDYY